MGGASGRRWRIAQQIATRRGVDGGVSSFLQGLPTEVISGGVTLRDRSRKLVWMRTRRAILLLPEKNCLPDNKRGQRNGSEKRIRGSQMVSCDSNVIPKPLKKKKKKKKI